MSSELVDRKLPCRVHGDTSLDMASSELRVREVHEPPEFDFYCKNVAMVSVPKFAKPTQLKLEDRKRHVNHLKATTKLTWIFIIRLVLTFGRAAGCPVVVGM